MPIADAVTGLVKRRRVWELYIDQLFDHNKTLADAAKTSNHKEWIDQTERSYFLWISYVIADITEGCGRSPAHIYNYIITPYTREHKEFVEEVDPSVISGYVDWAIPECFRKSLLENEFAPTSLVSPVHFWFFVHCEYQDPIIRRPLVPASPDDMFRHPLYYINAFHHHSTLVVPEYSLEDSAVFGELTDRSSTAFYVLPNFAHHLFKYIETVTDPQSPTFSKFYSELQPTYWVVEKGTENARNLTVAVNLYQQPFKFHWRWADVLERMLQDVETCKLRHRMPSWCSRVPDDKTPGIAGYVDSFGRIAVEWSRTRSRPVPHLEP